MPVGYSVAASLANLLGTGHPYTGSPLDVDARAIELGEPLYQDPADGHTAVTYTPLFPLVIAGLNVLLDWEGWGVLVTALAALALATAAGVLAYRPAGRGGLDRVVAVAGAVGIAALAWWLVSFTPYNFLFQSKQDHLSWALALGGLAAVPVAATRGSRLAGGAAVLALVAAFMTKQTTIVASVAAVLWLALAVRRGIVPARYAIGFTAALALLGAGVLALLVALTEAWAWRMAFELPAGQTRNTGWRSFEQLSAAAFAAAAVGAVFGLAALGLGRRPSSWRWPRSPRGELALVLALFLLVAVPACLWFDQKIGSLHNQFLGVVWALVLLAGAAWGAAQARAGAAIACGVAVLVAFWFSESRRLQHWLEPLSVSTPDKVDVTSFAETPAGLRRFAAADGVYHQVYSAINPRSVYPGHFSIDELLSGGYQPRFLVRALLDRRFGTAYLFNDRDRGPSYSSGLGEFEENYHWKLNQVLLSRYMRWQSPPSALAAAVDVPDGQYQSPGVLRRRPGPEPDVWMRRCFAPFRGGGLSWRIRAGGGFWCQAAGGVALTLRRTPAAWSELVADSSIEWPRGRLTVRLPNPGGGFRVRCGADFVLHGRLAGPRRLSLSMNAAGRRATVETRPGSAGTRIGFARAGRTSLAARDSGRVIASAPQSDCTPAIEATQGSGAVFEPAGFDGG